MKRGELEHIIRVCASVTGVDEIVVIGSQSILGRYSEAPSTFLVSNEADVFAKDHPELSDLIDGTLGEGSPFHETFGYYAQGVDESTAILPDGWKSRLVPVCSENTRGSTGLCLEPHDLVVSKALASRDKDVRFIRDALRVGLVDAATLRLRLDATDADPRLLTRARDLLAASHD